MINAFNLTIESTNITKCKASNKGGALFYSCSDPQSKEKDCTLKINNSQFI